MAAATPTPTVAAVLAIALFLLMGACAKDHNDIFQPCDDTKVQRFDGFTFGIAFSSKDSFSFNGTQLSPCDSRLSLSTSNARYSVFRPKVDEISLLSINGSTSEIIHSGPRGGGGYMVAFAGRKYAARSFPSFVGNDSYVVTSFTLVMEFNKGILQNLYWKTEGCSSCSQNKSSDLVCIDNQECAFKTSACRPQDGNCNLGIQVAFSGTDKHYTALNSWYEVSKLRQYSLFSLYSDLKNSLTSQFGNIF